VPFENERREVTLTHFGLEYGLDQLDPASWGKNSAILSRGERERLASGNINDPETKKRLLQLCERRQFDELRRWDEEEAKRLARARAEPLPDY